MNIFRKLFPSDAKHDAPALPAMWEPFRGRSGKSLFDDMDGLLHELRAEPEYQRYF